MVHARFYALASLTPLILLAVSLAMNLAAAAGPCPSPDSGGC